MSVIDSIQISGVTYTIQGSGGGGNPTVELTQAEYDAMVTAGTVSPNTYYIITDASAGDLSNYMSSAQTMSAITEATSGLQVTLTAGTGIDITDNVISATGGGGGGKAVTGGTNISVTTGETADTINCTLPITAGTGSMSVIMGNSSNIADKTAALSLGTVTKAQGQGSAAFGERTETTSKAPYSFTCGGYTITRNWHEFAGGKYNVSNTGSTDADNTLFSVGNGTADNARHNAFEIRQNGDIYITSGGTDILLQDNLGGGGGGGKAIEAGRGISVTTGETADTVSFNLPISAGTSTNSIIIGSGTASQLGALVHGISSTSNGTYTNVFGYNSYANGNYSFTAGGHLGNYVEFAAAFGKYNKTDNSPLFSVGNGTADNARHNAFEIRQNGDIYYFDGTNDVKLQDKFSSLDSTIGDINTILESI